ncbi:MAG: glycosyltransferase family 39 protein [Candidatus Dadabacteria bacterium]|nr:glycosyltransferase family 39 protein [Candidatus Dadabacteria bacterium]
MKNRGPFLDISLVIIFSTGATFFFGFLAYVILENKYPAFLPLWYTWDAQHYVEIARDWYTSSTVDERNLQIVFFPLYPLLIKIVAFFVGSYVAAGLWVSNLAFAGAAVYIYKLSRLDYDEDDSWRALVYLAIFPTAYFLHAVYTESLFLFLTIASFYHARRGNWALSGAAGLLASATRITGIVLIPALLIEYLAQRDYKLRETKKNVLWIGLTVLGFLFYLGINYVTFEDPFKFLEIQREHWGKRLDWPFNGFLLTYNTMLSREPEVAMLNGWFEIFFVIFGLVLSIYALLKVRVSYGVFALINWIVMTSTWWWQSIPRYLLVVFPVFLSLSLLGRSRAVNFIITFSSLLLYALFLLQLVRFRWAF